MFIERILRRKPKVQLTKEEIESLKRYAEAPFDSIHTKEQADEFYQLAHKAVKAIGYSVIGLIWMASFMQGWCIIVEK